MRLVLETAARASIPAQRAQSCHIPFPWRTPSAAAPIVQWCRRAAAQRTALDKANIACVDSRYFFDQGSDPMRAHRLFLSAILLSALTVPAAAQQQPAFTKAGALTCRTSASVGLLVGSRQRLSCVFRRDSGGEERYSGTIGRVGLDVGITAGGVLGWAVLARTRGLARGALAGTYVGASGDIALGIGAGANVLIGGSHRTVALQPVSVEGQIGVNLALGVARLTLRAGG